MLRRRFHATDWTISVLTLFLPPVVSLLFVPVVSFKSDRRRGPWGRRIPYLLWTTPVAAGAMAALAYSGDFGTWAAHALGRWSGDAWSLLCFGVCWTTFECAALTSLALMNALVNDVVPRPVLGRFYGLFRAVSLVVGMGFNFWVFRYADLHYRAILIGVAVLFGAGFTVMCLTVREGDYPPPPPAEDDAGGAVGRRFAAVGTYLRDSFRDPYFRWVFAAITLGALTFLPVNTFSLFYAGRVRMSDGTFGNLLALTYLISLAMAWPMGWLVDRLSSLSVATGCVIAYAVAMLAAGVAVGGPRSFGVAFVAHGVLSGCFFTAAASLPQALLPRMRFGQFASAAGIIQSLGTMTLGLTMGPILDRSGHNYRLTFYGGGGLALVAAASMLVVIARRRHHRPAADD